MRWLAILALGALAGACFDPDYPEGVPCSAEDGACPPGLLCDPRDGVCRAELLPGTCGDGILQEIARETCDFGADPCCNRTCDGVLAAGTECREAAGICDLAETCDGTAASCPGDAFADGAVCDTCPAGPGSCECSGGVCADLCGNGRVDDAAGEACDGDAPSPCPGLCNPDCTCPPAAGAAPDAEVSGPHSGAASDPRSCARAAP